MRQCVIEWQGRWDVMSYNGMECTDERVARPIRAVRRGDVRGGASGRDVVPPPTRVDRRTSRRASQ